MFKLRIIFSFSLLFFIGISAISQEITTPEKTYISLSETIRLAQERSPDALINIHRFRRSYWEYRSFRAGYLPNVTMNATLPNFTRSIDAITQADGSESYRDRTLSRYSADIALTQKIGLTGGEVFLQSGLQRIDNYFTDTTTNQFLSQPISIGFRQPIFGYNAYKWDKEIEPMRYQEAERGYLESQEQVAITATNHFFNLLMAQIERSISLKNQSNYDTLFNIAKGRYVLGKIAENELLQLELNLLRADAAVENADLEYQNMLFKYKSYLRLTSNETLVLVPPAETFHFNIQVEEAINEAHTNTSAGLAFDRRMLEAASDVSMAKLQGRFDAELFASFGLTQTANKISEVYNDPLQEERVSLGLTIPILDWGQARGRIRMAESSYDLIETSIEQERLDFDQDIFLKVMQFGMQQNQLTIAAKADTVAQKRFDVTQKRYMIGKVNDVLELNNAQIDNDNAKKGYYSALKSYWINYFELRKTTLFDFNKNEKIVFDTEELIEQ